MGVNTLIRIFLMMLRLVTQKPSERLREIVNAIPDGEVSATARRAGMSQRYLQKMRAEPVNVGIDTLASICAGLGRGADDLMGLKPPDPLAPEVERLRALVAALEATNAGLRKAVAQLAQLPAVPQSGAEPPRRPRASRKG